MSATSSFVRSTTPPTFRRPMIARRKAPNWGSFYARKRHRECWSPGVGSARSQRLPEQGEDVVGGARLRGREGGRSPRGPDGFRAALQQDDAPGGRGRRGAGVWRGFRGRCGLPVFVEDRPFDVL